MTRKKFVGVQVLVGRPASLIDVFSIAASSGMAKGKHAKAAKVIIGLIKFLGILGDVCEQINNGGDEGLYFPTKRYVVILRYMKPRAFTLNSKHTPTKYAHLHTHIITEVH